MTIISDVLKELFSMFVADARLSLAILLLVLLVAMLVAAFPAEPVFGGVFLLFGSVAILIEAVRREARTRLRE
jgi:polyferredoxin